MKITCYILICLLLFPGFIPITTAHTLAATSSVFANEKISSQAGNASTHPLWQVVMYEDFEGDFPGQWTVSVAPGAADAYWGKEDYNIYNPQNPYDGNFAAYCAKNGSQAVILPGYYPPNMDTTMTGGPFDLSLATDATFSFVAKSAIGGGQDRFEYSVSLDGVNFFGDSFGEEDNSERLITLDMKNVPGLGNICGQPQVWVSFRFVSDHVSENRRGITVDDVLLSQWVPQGSPPQITSISPDTASAGTDTPVTITGTDFGETEGIVEFWQVSRNYKQADVISWSDTEIICTVPSGASGSEEVNGVLYGVRVFGPGGWSRDHPFTVTFSYSGVKWPGDNPCGVRFVVNNITSDCTGALEAIISAAQTWNRVTGADFYFEYGGTDQPGDFVVTWRDDGPGGGTAYGGIHKDSVTGEIISAQIVFNDYHDWSTGGSMNYDIQRTATHEFGHWLMLDDLYGEDNRGKMMFGGASSALAPEDIEGIRWIYPGTGTRGQYHLSVTNNTANPQEVYFKSDIDAEFTRSFTVPAGETKNSWWEVAPAGSRQVSIRWTDPADGVVQTLVSNYKEVLIKGDTEYSFIIEASQPVNHPPVLNPIGNKTGTVGEPIQFTVSAFDPDGDPLTYTATTLPEGASFDMNTHTFSWTPDTAGFYAGITFSVTDGKSPPVSETITITVGPLQPEYHSLTVTTQGQGTVVKTPDQVTYQAGTTVQVTAVPSPGWSFSHWTGDVADPDVTQTSVTMDGDKTVTATFTQNSQSPGGGGGGSGSSGGGGGGGSASGDKRFTNISGSATSEGVLWEDVTVLSTDIQAELRIQKGTIVLNGNGYPLHTITVSKATDPRDAGPGMARIGDAYDFTPNGTTFEGPATLKLYYDPANLPSGVDKANLGIATWSKETETWDVLPSQVNADEDYVAAGITHFSRFAIVIGTRPAELSVGNLSVTPDPAEHGETVTVTAGISNAGDLAGTFDVVYKVDETDAGNRRITLKGGESRDVEFTFAAATAGRHTIEINGATASFEVLPVPASFSIRNTTLSPETIHVGNVFTVAMTVVNTGGADGFYELEYCLNGNILETLELYVAAGTEEEVELSLIAQEPGLHTVEVNGISLGTLSVEPVPEPEETIGVESSTSTAPTSTTTDDQGRGWTIVMVLIAVIFAVATGVAIVANYRANRVR